MNNIVPPSQRNDREKCLCLHFVKGEAVPAARRRPGAAGLGPGTGAPGCTLPGSGVQDLALTGGSELGSAAAVTSRRRDWHWCYAAAGELQFKSQVTTFLVTAAPWLTALQPGGPPAARGRVVATRDTVALFPASDSTARRTSPAAGST